MGRANFLTGCLDNMFCGSHSVQSVTSKIAEMVHFHKHPMMVYLLHRQWFLLWNVADSCMNIGSGFLSKLLGCGKCPIWQMFKPIAQGSYSSLIFVTGRNRTWQICWPLTSHFMGTWWFFISKHLLSDIHDDQMGNATRCFHSPSHHN